MLLQVHKGTASLATLARGATNACTVQILVDALTFFIGERDLGRRGSDDDSDEQSKPKMTMKDVQKKFNKMGSKKTRKKEKKLRNAIQKLNKEKKASAPKPNFPAIQLLHDPQGASRHVISS